MFDLRTAKRVYYLVASSEDEMNKWVECICSVCGLKMEAVQNELSLLPPMDVGSVVLNANGSGIGGGNVISSDERYSPQPSHYPSNNNNSSQALTLKTSAPTLASSGTVSETQIHQSSPLLPFSSSSSSITTTTTSTQLSLTNLNEPSLNYIPISECFTGQPLNDGDMISHSSPPPPRPPKPWSLQYGHKSQSSLALWPTDLNNQQQQPVLPPHSIHHSSQTLRPTSNNHGSSPLIQKVSTTSSTTIIGPNNNNIERPLYLNHNNNHHQHHPSHHQYELCNANIGTGVVVFSAGVEMPPQVNRDLKPNRRYALSGRSMDGSR